MGLKSNIIYNSILTASNYVVILVTFPYVARVLGVEQIGVYNYVTNIISFFALLSTFGVNTLGIREVATHKDNLNDLNSTFSNLISLQLIYTIVSIAILFILTSYYPKFHELRYFFYLGGLQLLMGTLSLDWLFKGLENFKYITSRTIVIRVLFIISLFLFIRSEKDTLIYFILNLGTYIATAVINIAYSTKFVKFKVKNIAFFEYFKDSFSLGIYSILTSMYTTFNVVFLGSTQNAVEVGLYTTALKIYTVILALYTAFTSVMLPRMSNILSKDDKSQFYHLLNKSIHVLISFACPVIIFSMIFSEEIIYVIAGRGYEGASILMRVIMPLVLVVGLAQILVFQIIIPSKRNKWTLIVSFIGAVVGILMNIALVPKLAAIGTAISLVVTELLVTTIYTYLVYAQTHVEKKYLSISEYKKLIVSILPSILVCICIKFLPVGAFLRLGIGLCFGLIYLVILHCFYLKTDYIINLIPYKLKSFLLK